MHKNWPINSTVGDEAYYPGCVGFTKAKKAFRLRNSDWIESEQEVK